MANYSGTPVVVVPAWEEGDRQGKRIRIRRVLTIVLATQGGLTNLIPVSTLGILAGQCSYVNATLFVDGGTLKRTISLFTDGTNVYTADPQVGTDVSRGLPADVTGTLTFEIAGLPA